MCVVCGCATDLHPQARAAPDAAPSPAARACVAVSDARRDAHGGDLHYGLGPAQVSVPGLGAERLVKIEADVLGENKRIAALNRAHFAAHGVTALNLVSSPGSGKTTLLCATIHALRAHAPGLRVAVIEGDQQTSFDADRIRATGAPAVQVNTGRGCHLDAVMVGQAYAQLHHHGQGDQHDHHPEHPHSHPHPHPHPHGHDHPHSHAHGGGQGPSHQAIAGQTHHPAHGQMPAGLQASPAPEASAELLFIENVGNLVCPALWDLGEAAKVVVLSVTEGDDKPLKYPDMFAAASLMLLNKIDLLPHVEFDVDRCIALARRVNPGIQVLQLSATRGEGMRDWLDWLLRAPAQRPA